MTEVPNDILTAVDTKIRAYRRDLHAHAEAGWAEYRTASLVAERLEELGFQIKVGREVLDAESRMGLPDDETMERQYQRALSEGAPEKYAQKMKGGFAAVVGEIEHGSGPVIAFRFDMDAVEMEEKDDPDHLPSREGFLSGHPEAMHSCGHDGHTSIGLGLAEVLSGLREQLRGRIKLIFQPAEEGVRGAKAMVEAGVVDDVDYMFGMHIGAKATTTGEFYCGTDGFLATSKFDAYFYGRSAHAGFEPQDGKNALLSGATAVLNLHAIPRHGGGGTRINVGKMSAGSGRNVIPSEAQLVIETRGENSDLNLYMKRYAEEVIRSAAEMHGNEYEIVQMGEAESADSDDELLQRVHAIAKRHSLFPELRTDKAHLGGSEDFTHMMKRVNDKGGRAGYMMLGSELKGSHHTVKFDFDESILIKGVEMLALIALELPEELQEEGDSK